jgi:hypothetical protein
MVYFVAFKMNIADWLKSVVLDTIRQLLHQDKYIIQASKRYKLESLYEQLDNDIPPYTI